MLTSDGLEGSGDVQAQDAGDEDSDYARPFGVPEDKPSSLGFKDPAAMDAAIKRLNKKYYPPWWKRLERWARRHLRRIRQ